MSDIYRILYLFLTITIFSPPNYCGEFDNSPRDGVLFVFEINDLDWYDEKIFYLGYKTKKSIAGFYNM